MSANDRTCPSCGARVPADADRCDLCGTSIEEASETPEGTEEDPPSDETVPPDGDDEGGEAGREADDSAEGPPVFCNECGWENPPGAKYCSRCGDELQDLSEATPSGTRQVSADLPSGQESAGEEADAPPSSPDASTVDEGSSKEGDDEQVTMGRQIALVVGGALVLVLGLFFVTQWSSQYEWGTDGASGPRSAQAGAEGGGSSAARSTGGQRPPGGAGPGSRQSSPTDLETLLAQTTDSLTGPIAGQVDSLRARIEQASGTSKRQLQAQLVNLYIGAGHPGRAALVQKDLAAATGTVNAQRRAADLLYRWMQKLQGQGQRQQVVQVARHASQAYEQVVNQRPNDLDARTRMGETYLLTNEPMKGIKAINAVLDDDSTFVPARFQKGLALLQINRLDQATKQFEMVRQYAENGSPFYQQAGRALKVIRQRRNQSTSGTSSPAPGTNR